METNESLVRKWLAAGDRGDLHELEHCLHPEVIVHAPFGLSADGLKEEEEVWKRAKAAVADLHHEVLEVVSGATTAAARVVVRGTLDGEFAGFTGKGVPFEADMAVFVHVYDGHIAGAWQVVDTGALERQLGPREG